jgi:hypothetical protein
MYAFKTIFVFKMVEIRSFTTFRADGAEQGCHINFLWKIELPSRGVGLCIQK